MLINYLEDVKHDYRLSSVPVSARTREVCLEAVAQHPWELKDFCHFDLRLSIQVYNHELRPVILEYHDMAFLLRQFRDPGKVLVCFGCGNNRSGINVHSNTPFNLKVLYIKNRIKST